MAKANIGKLLLTGVVGGAIALGGSAIYQSTTEFPRPRPKTPPDPIAIFAWQIW